MLSYFELLFSELEEVAAGDQSFFLPCYLVDLEMVVRVGWGLYVHIDVEYFEAEVFGASFDAVFLGWVVLGGLVLFLVFSKGNAGVHTHQFRQKSVVLLVDVEVSHYSVGAGVGFSFAFISDSGAFRRREYFLAFWIGEVVLAWWLKMVERGLFFLTTWLISAIFLRCLRYFTLFSYSSIYYYNLFKNRTLLYNNAITAFQ